MTTLSQEAHVIPGFDEARFIESNSGSNDLISAKRKAAYETCLGLPTPTNQTEEWRRTDPSLFPVASQAILPALSGSSYKVADNDDQFDLVVTVDNQRFAIEDRNGLAAKGIVVSTLDAAAVSHADLVQKYLGGEVLPDGFSKFTALNAAFWNVGLFVHIPSGMEIEKGILIRYNYKGVEGVLLPRLVVSAESGAKGTIVERLVSDDASKLTVISCKELYQGPAAGVRVIAQQLLGKSSVCIANDMARVERDGQVDWITLNFGAKAAKMLFGSDVAGENTAAELDGIYLAEKDQHIDQKTLQVHSSPNTYSRLLYKGAVRDAAHSVYQGVIQAKPGAIKVDAYQTNNNIVLNDGARADTIPGLLIDADDLKCSHGATIGNIDEEQVFYLRARGLSENEARKLVIMGFFDEIIERIPYEFIREEVRGIIIEKLGNQF